MAKNRIVIADLADEYVEPLQAKFIEEQFDLIDLEIITDACYFNKLFSTPQQIDVLIVDEKLYSDSLNKHNIKNIFVLVENIEISEKKEKLYYQVLKYSTTKEIYNFINVKSRMDREKKERVKKSTQVILVTSSKGGEGKTTFSMGLCKKLDQNYKKVLYINVEHLHTFHVYLQNAEPIPNNGFYSELMNSSGNLVRTLQTVIRNEEFDYVPPFKASISALGLQKHDFIKIVKLLKATNMYDYIVVDTDNSFDTTKIDCISLADKVMILTKQSKESVFATSQLVKSISDINSDKYMFVCNFFNKEMPNYLEGNVNFSINEFIMDNTSYVDTGYLEISKDVAIERIAYMMV